MNWAENIKKLRNKMLLIQQELVKILNVAMLLLVNEKMVCLNLQ